ncbi:hypothetical protein EAI_14284, partial [Harpegnathos saltator]
IGPFFLPPRLDGQRYAEFLENKISLLLEDVPLRIREIIIFQHDDAPAHSSRAARQVLNRRF